MDLGRPTGGRRWQMILALGISACETAEEKPNVRHVEGDACTVEVEVLASLRGDQVNRSGVGLVSEQTILLVTNVARHEILVFDRQGSFMRSVGRQGEGPGEYLTIHELRSLPDSRLAVIDARQARITILDQDFGLQKVVRIPVIIYPHGAVSMADGGWLLSGLSMDRDHFGSAVVEVDSAGVPRWFYGENETIKEGPARGQMPTRHLAFDPSMGVITMQAYDYAIEVWSPEGPLAEVIRPPSDWFHWPPEGFEGRRGEGPNVGAIGQRPPEDRVAGIQFDQEGRLWILSQVTPENWRDGLDENGQIVDRATYVDFMLQIYDLDRRASVCLVRLGDDFYFGGFAGQGMLKTYSEDSIANPEVSIHRLTVR